MVEPVWIVMERLRSQYNFRNESILVKVFFLFYLETLEVLGLSLNLTWFTQTCKKEIFSEFQRPNCSASPMLRAPESIPRTKMSSVEAWHGSSLLSSWFYLVYFEVSHLVNVCTLQCRSGEQTIISCEQNVISSINDWAERAWAFASKV